MNIEIREAHLFDALDLAGTMRAADRREVEATSGRPVFDVLVEGLTLSSEAYTAVVDEDVVLCMWGVVPANDPGVLGPRIGWGWLLTSETVDVYPKAFWQACKAEIRRLLETWDGIYNAIDCRHTKALRWASFLGFVLEDPEPMGCLGLPFRRFSVSKEDLNV